MEPKLLILIIGFLWPMILWDLGTLYNAKKCKYNCDKCKNWNCYHHYCERKRNKLKERGKDV